MQINVQDLSYTYSVGMPYETTALSGVSFTVTTGEFIALIGHTGSGKSTLAQLLIGLIAPTGGHILADGVDLHAKTPEAKSARRRIGMVFQYPEYQLFEETVLKDVCFGPKNMGLSEEEQEARARRAMKLVGLDSEMEEQSPFSLSGGQKRRVAIAGVLAMEPEVLILDEPTAGLDPQGRREILTMIDAIRGERELTIFFITHDMDAAAAMATRVLVMDGGRLAMNGSPRDIFSRSEELAAIGLDLPAPARLLSRLKARGLAIRTDALTADEAERWLSETLH